MQDDRLDKEPAEGSRETVEKQLEKERAGGKKPPQDESTASGEPGAERDRSALASTHPGEH